MTLSHGHFLVKAVPANGYKTYAVKVASPGHAIAETSAMTLETTFYRVTFDHRAGSHRVAGGEGQRP